MTSVYLSEHLWSSCSICSGGVWDVTCRDGTRWLRHGENPEHSKPYNEHESTYAWLVKLHQYEEAV